MVDIASNILKNIFSKKLTKAKEGIAKSLKTKSLKAIEDYKNSFKFELPNTETSTTPETTKEGLDDVRRANRDKEASLRKVNREKEIEVRRSEQEKENEKRKMEREKDTKKEDIVQKVMEYIKTDGARRRCDGGDGRRTENHNCDKVHSGMSHNEWEASQDTPKDEATGDKKAYTAFINKKMKKYGVTSPSQLSTADKKKFYNEIDREWQGDNEED